MIINVLQRKPTNRGYFFSMNRPTRANSHWLLELGECEPTIILLANIRIEIALVKSNNQPSNLQREITSQITWSIAIRTGISFTSDSSSLNRTTTPTEAYVVVIPI